MLQELYQISHIDITTEMVDGTFKYDLTLPLAQ
jgi:hypothetical protein